MGFIKSSEDGHRNILAPEHLAWRFRNWHVGRSDRCIRVLRNVDGSVGLGWINQEWKLYSGILQRRSEVEMSSPEDFVNHSREELIMFIVATQKTLEIVSNTVEMLNHRLFEARTEIEELKSCLK